MVVWPAHLEEMWAFTELKSCQITSLLGAKHQLSASLHPKAHACLIDELDLVF